METLGEVYEHQAGLIKKLSKDIARLRNVREDNEERLEEINNVADEQRVSGILFAVCVGRVPARAFCVPFVLRVFWGGSWRLD